MVHMYIVKFENDCNSPIIMGVMALLSYFGRMMVVGEALLFSACPSVCLSVRCCGHSNFVIFDRISSKFHIWIASIKFWFKFEYVFFRRRLNKHTYK